MNLTWNEKTILYHLVAYPEFLDKEISTKVRLGISTVTKIRNRLLADGYLKAQNIPSVQKIGAEILDIGYGEFNPNIPLDEKIEQSKEWVDTITGTFLTIGDGNQAMGMGFYRNYTDAMRSIIQTKRLVAREPMMTTGDLQSLLFSFRLAHIFRFFNFAPLLATSIGVDDPQYSEPDNYLKYDGDVHLTRKEKIVLYGLVRYPEHNDKNLSKLLGISRQTISAVKKRFRRDGIITRCYIPDLAKLGFEVVVFAHVQLKNAVELDPESLRQGMTEDTNITSLLHGNDIITLSANMSFASTKERIASFLRDTKLQGKFTRDPVIYLWSASDLIQQIDHFYHIPVARILGIDPESLTVDDTI